jgi:pilus assembly protein CpaE
VARTRPHGAQGRECERGRESGPESGQAAVEFLAVLPAALLVALAGWQLALAGQAVWLSGNAARAGARAQAVGGDPRSAARSALPSYLRRGLVVRGDGGRVTVRVAVPLLSRRWRTPISVGASAALRQP